MHTVKSAFSHKLIMRIPPSFHAFLAKIYHQWVRIYFEGRLTPLIHHYGTSGGGSQPWPTWAQTILMASCLISNPGNSANTDSISQAKERSYPWTNKHILKEYSYFHAQGMNWQRLPTYIIWLSGTYKSNKNDVKPFHDREL